MKIARSMRRAAGLLVASIMMGTPAHAEEPGDRRNDIARIAGQFFNVAFALMRIDTAKSRALFLESLSLKKTMQAQIGLANTYAMLKAPAKETVAVLGDVLFNAADRDNAEFKLAARQVLDELREKTPESGPEIDNLFEAVQDFERGLAGVSRQPEAAACAAFEESRRRFPSVVVAKLRVAECRASLEAPSQDLLDEFVRARDAAKAEADAELEKRASESIRAIEPTVAFNLGFESYSKGDYPRACPAFEKSQRGRPARATRFALAACREQGGFPVPELLLEYESIADDARREEDPAMAGAARERYLLVKEYRERMNVTAGFFATTGAGMLVMATAGLVAIYGKSLETRQTAASVADIGIGFGVVAGMVGLSSLLINQKPSAAVLPAPATTTRSTLLGIGPYGTKREPWMDVRVARDNASLVLKVSF